MYTIKVEYTTGDSFSTEETDTTLDASWNLEVAKDNLSRIKEHYMSVKNIDNYYSIAMQEKAKEEIENIKTKSWYSSKYWEHSIMLLENDGSLKQYRVTWTGYFESLQFASIRSVSSDNGDMSFSM